MEKGNVRNTTSKTNNPAESKSKQDGGIKYTRFTRYKPESISPRPDARLKPNPQKSQESFDKRPRTRSGAICERYRNEVAVGDIAGGKKQGSKKVNLNHLLNFTLRPVDGIGRDFSSRGAARGYRAKIPKYNKEQFLQANCQFIAREDGDYSLHCKNPDILVHWSLIEEVRVPSHEVPSCPICLYTPVAAKITRCGHVFCWACILHYLALTDKQWEKCPICFEAIYGIDLRSVLPITKAPIAVGNKVSMCLMKREKGSMFPVPSVYESSLSVYRMHDIESVTKYQKLLLASKDDVYEIIYREKQELEAQLLKEADEPEACFIKQALELLHERESLNHDSAGTETKEEFEQEHILDSQYSSLERRNNIDADVLGKSMSSIPDCEPVHDNSFGMSATNNSDSKSSVGLFEVEAFDELHKKGKGTFYFYQAEDGQLIYLHGLNVRMLIKEFGSLEDSPPLIEGQVIELEKISMTEVLRRRLRYLQHIPLTCEFQVAELNLDHILSKTTIKEFAGEVSKRYKLRHRKANEERKREKYIEEVENKRLGKYPSATYNLNSPIQFPFCDTRGETSAINDLSHSENYEAQYPSFGISDLSLKENTETSPPVASFAQMLRDGQVSFNQALPQRDMKHLQFQKPTVDQDYDNSDGETATAIPEYRQSFSNAIQAAFDIAISEGNNAGKNTASKKKKKVKNRVLFTTSMCRTK